MDVSFSSSAALQAAPARFWAAVTPLVPAVDPRVADPPATAWPTGVPIIYRSAVATQPRSDISCSVFGRDRRPPDSIPPTGPRLPVLNSGRRRRLPA